MTERFKEFVWLVYDEFPLLVFEDEAKAKAYAEALGSKVKVAKVEIRKLKECKF